MGGGLIRVLGIEPVTRGFGWSVVEGMERLVDWGIVTRREARERRLKWLLSQYRPTAVAVPTLPVTRRKSHAAAVLSLIDTSMESTGYAVQGVPRSLVLEEFSGCAATTRRSVAKALSNQFPSLGIVDETRPWWWKDETERLSVFWSLALAIASQRCRN